MHAMGFIYKGKGAAQLAMWILYANIVLFIYQTCWNVLNLAIIGSKKSNLDMNSHAHRQYIKTLTMPSMPLVSYAVWHILSKIAVSVLTEQARVRTWPPNLLSWRHLWASNSRSKWLSWKGENSWISSAVFLWKMKLGWNDSHTITKYVGNELQYYIMQMINISMKRAMLDISCKGIWICKKSLP